MQVLPAGPDALLVELSVPAEVPLLYADLRRDLACADLVPGARTVLLDGVADLDAARDYLARWVPAGGSADRVGPLVELATTYDGADLDDVAGRTLPSRHAQEVLGDAAAAQQLVVRGGDVIENAFHVDARRFAPKLAADAVHAGHDGAERRVHLV